MMNRETNTEFRTLRPTAAILAQKQFHTLLKKLQSLLRGLHQNTPTRLPNIGLTTIPDGHNKGLEYQIRTQ